MLSNSEAWLPLEDMPPLTETTRVRHFQVLLDKDLQGCRIHTAKYALSGNDRVMVIVGGHFLYDLGCEIIRWRDLPEIPEGL